MINIRYTLCFLTFEDQVLLLHRANPPNKGFWNGVGGHIETGESPLTSCLREVYEETGKSLQSLACKGILTWQGFEINDGGLVLFSAPANNTKIAHCNEGKLAWKPRNFLFNSPKVVSNLRLCAPHFMNSNEQLQYHFVYNRLNILSFSIRRLPHHLCLSKSG